MKVDVFTISGRRAGKLELPKQFNEPVRDDLIKRAVLSIQSHNYQPYGADPIAGTRQGDATSKRRRKYKTTYGRGISRVKRKYLWHRGRQFRWVGALIANVRGGRKAFPPLAWKVIRKKINDKERRKAIRSAISASQSLFIEDKVETVNKTKDAKYILEKIGLKKDISRATKVIRSGRGKTRGRKYRQKKGPLVVVSKTCAAMKAMANISGVDIVEVNNLNAELLAPGTVPGRKTIWTVAAVQRMGKEGLFI